MKLLETTTATIEFEIVGDAYRDSDPRLADAVIQTEKLRQAIHEARNEIVALRRKSIGCAHRRRPTACTSGRTTTIPSTSSRRDERCECGSTRRSESSRCIRVRSCS